VSRLIRLFGIATVVGVVAAYLTFSHFLTITEQPHAWMLIIGVMPLLAMSVMAAWSTPMRWWVCALLATLMLMASGYLDALRNHINWLYFVQHAGAMTLLALTFGSTLGSGDADALCSRVTRLLLAEEAEPTYMRYTWKVTVAWTVFFVTSALLSITLFFGGPLVVWSFFANILTPILVGVMFVVEYLIRVRVLPHRTHFSIAQIIGAYRSYEHH
jgi:uncharacterized membrane protein